MSRISAKPPDPGPRRRRRAALWITFGLVVLLVVLSFLPGRVVKTLNTHDEVSHAMAFAALLLPSALLVPRWVPAVLALALALGAVIELLQPWAGRTASWEDLALNALGAGLGTGLGLLLHRILVARGAPAFPTRRRRVALPFR